MSITRTAGILWLLLSCCFCPKAQNDYRIEHFTTDNGLPSNGIKGLQWDGQTGFLWIATEAGITRYNGADFVTFNRSNTPGFFSERMLFLLKSRDGRLYTSDEVGDLFLVLRNKPQFTGQIRVDARPTTFRLIGLIASGKLFRQSSQQAPAGFGFDFSLQTLIPLDEKRLLLTQHDSLYDYVLGRPVPEFLTVVPPGSKLFSLRDSVFLFDPATGFYRMSPDYKSKTPLSAPAAAAEGKPQLFWDNSMSNPVLVKGCRAWLLDYREGRLTERLVCDSLPTDASLVFVRYDAGSGLLFLGTFSKGIFVVHQNAVRAIKKAAGPAGADRQTAYYSQIALPGEAILTSNGDVLGNHAPGSEALPVHGSFNNFVLTTPDSVLWYSSNDTIYSWSYRKKTRTVIPAGEGSITDGFVLSEGDLYVANAIGIGIIRRDRVDYQYRYPKSDINGNAPFAAQEISPGLIAIATCDGLFRYNILTHLVDTLWRAPGICVRSLWKYKGYLFIGTYGKGIFLYKNGQIRPIPLDKSKYLQYAHCFIPDRRGFCWISTNKGVFRASPEDMTAAFDDSRRTVYYHYYGRADGMDMTELNGGCTPCALALNDSTLSFPSMDGLVWVDPSRPVTGLPGGAIYIDEFMADSQVINNTSLLRPELPASTRELVFSLGFPAWAGKENLYIEYRLEPYSHGWQLLDIQNNPRLRFSNLPSGVYRLEIRQTNGFSNSYIFTAASFRIIPRWWQQPWSWLLSLALLAAFIGGIVRWRTRRLELRQSRLERQIADKTRELQAKNEELERTDQIKTRLISIISHDLVTPLRFLHMTGRNLIEKKHGLTEELQQEAIGEMATTSKELELLSTNILNWIKYRNEDRRLAKESFNLNELVTQLFGIFQAMARQKEVRLVNATEADVVLFQYIEPVKIVLYNLILNGINFTAKGHIRVSCLRGGDSISLVIEDTGVGMTQEQINNIMADHFIISSANVDNRKGNGLGYLIIKDLLKILRGRLSIQSEKGRGAKISVWVPL
jgi:signal transduction histidine kinase